MASLEFRNRISSIARRALSQDLSTRRSARASAECVLRGDFSFHGAQVDSALVLVSVAAHGGPAIAERSFNLFCAAYDVQLEKRQVIVTLGPCARGNAELENVDTVPVSDGSAHVCAMQQLVLWSFGRRRLI